MLNAILTSILSFISTNIDDIFVLTIFFAQCHAFSDRLQVTLGQYIGIGCLTVLSLLGAYGLQLLPPQYIGLLGLLPIALGAKEIVNYRKNRGLSKSEEAAPAHLNCFSVALVTIANGGDNVGVYIPLFAGFSPQQTFCAMSVFAVMVAMWCFLAGKLSELPVLRTFIRSYKHIIVPLVLIALGVYILASSYI